ncbi:peptidase C39 [Neorhizobium sp. P12A]|nr:peptidase C39 [Neorhizobium sp. P12A]
MSLNRWAVLGFYLSGFISLTSGALAEPIRDSTMSATVPGLYEPLIPTHGTSPAEDQDLSFALEAFRHRSTPSDLSSLTTFLAAHPNSGWSSALWTNVGLADLHDGYFSNAIVALDNAWSEGDDATSPEGHALVDRSIGELANLEASLGKTEDLRALFERLGNRKVSGSATELIQTARETLALAGNEQAHLFNCGPLALRALMLALEANPSTVNFLQFYNPGPNGTTLAEVAGLADGLKLAYRLVHRLPGDAVPVPAIVHWKVGHFATITSKENGRYHIRDAVFPNADIWMTPEALDAEASGDFLVPAAAVFDDRWKSITIAEAASVHGRGETYQTRKGDAGDPLANGPGSTPADPKSPVVPPTAGNNPNQSHWNSSGQNDNNDPSAGCPLCVVNIKESSVSVTLSDMPVGYVPPIGPSMKVSLSYNQREDSQPANFDYYNISQKWTLNWQSYVIDDPTNPGANVSRVLGSGGAFYYLGYDAVHHSFAAQDDDGSILSFTSQTAISYHRQLRDGSVEVYEQSDGSVAYPRKIFLTKVIDPQGNAATLHYDRLKRLTSVTDAVGRNTTFSYEIDGRPLLVSSITDPFGRRAKLTYDELGRLISITDILGLTSSFTYDANSLINSLTTPYGTSNFSYTAPGTSAPPRFVQITDPLGNKEREEWLEPAPIPGSDPVATVPVGMPVAPTNGYLVYRNSFHWDKSAYVTANCGDSGGCDYTKARIRHFVHMPGSTIKGTAIESEKYPLENRVWYNYPGQTDSTGSVYGGSYNRPIAIGRVLDDGTTQISSYAYDSNGNITQATDPYGRTIYYSYTDGIDIAAVSQADQFGARSTLAQFVYNDRHRPVYFADAAGRASTFEYNSAGQMASFSDTLGEKTSFHYDGAANLASITNANNATAATYTYDAFDRIRSYTDSEGWTVTFDYDAADRVTKITYPDGTSKRYGYQRLDLISYKDREGRLWQYQYNANRRLTAIVDPMRQMTKRGYDPSGNLTSLTDPKENVTAWGYDVQDRQISKTYADHSVVAYTYENTTSRLKSVLDALGQTKQYTYTIDNNLSGLTYLNAVNPTPNVSFTYDPYFQRIASMTDGVGTTTYSYNPSFVDGAQKLAQECFRGAGAATCSHTITYGYDALGRSASRQISGSGAETWAYDAIGRVINHSSDLGAFELSYLGQTQQLTVRQLLPTTSTLKTVWSYLDNTHDRRLAGIANTGLTSGQFTNFTFDTTPENFITGITQTSDAAIIEPSPTLQTAAFNNLNEVTSASGQIYSYDLNGNLISDGARSYSWDADNRLISISSTAQPGDIERFAYDGLGRRVEIDEASTTDNLVASKYVWCGKDLCQKRDASYNPARVYLGEGEFVIGAVNPSLFYGVDQSRSIRRVFENTTDAPAYDYDAWGVASNAAPRLTDFGYSGLVGIKESGVMLAVYRGYSGPIGRWLSRDPIGEQTDESSNLFAYSQGNPISLSDPYGLASQVHSPPFQGPPGSTIVGRKQSRFYGPDGYPQTDRDLPHPNESGIGAGDHSHDWTRPPDGSPPASENRCLSREPLPDDPPPPLGYPETAPTSPEIPEIPELPEIPFIFDIP